MNQPHQNRSSRTDYQTIIVHTITYFGMGILAFTFLHYAVAFSSGQLASFMRPTSDPIVMAGVLFQPIRGIVFALAFYPLRKTLFGQKNGWLVLWWTLIAFGHPIHVCACTCLD